MAMWLFADASGKAAIKLFNNGQMRRDFTYVDDVVESIARLVPVRRRRTGWSGDAPDPRPATPHGTSTISAIAPGRGHRGGAPDRGGGRQPAIRELWPMQPGDVPRPAPTSLISSAPSAFGPKLRSGGISRFVEWFLRFDPN